MRTKKIILLLIALLITPPLFAEEVIIADTSGIVRSVTEVNASATIRFTVTDPNGKPLDGALVILTSKDLVEKRQGISVAGVVEFLDVGPGQWTVSTENSNLLFTQIDVGEFGNALAAAGSGSSATAGAATTTGGTTTVAATTAGAGAGLSTGAMIGAGVLAAGGITGLAVAIDESNSNDQEELSPFS